VRILRIVRRESPPSGCRDFLAGALPGSQNDIDQALAARAARLGGGSHVAENGL
jgi:hypothetical protein